MRGQKLFDGTNGCHGANVRRFGTVAPESATTTFMFPNSSTFLKTGAQASTVSYELHLPQSETIRLINACSTRH